MVWACSSMSLNFFTLNEILDRIEGLLVDPIQIQDLQGYFLADSEFI
jgi:hypothetical protein